MAGYFFAHFTANIITRAEKNRRKLLDMAAMDESYGHDETDLYNTRASEYAAELYQRLGLEPQLVRERDTIV